MTEEWFHTLEHDIHAADVARQKALMRELIDAGYTALRQQYAGHAARLDEVEQAYAYLTQLVDDFQG